MTNEQTAVMLGGILAEIEKNTKIISEYFNGNNLVGALRHDKHIQPLVDLADRLQGDISTLRGEDYCQSIFSEAK